MFWINLKKWERSNKKIEHWENWKEIYCFQGSKMESVTRKRELRRKQVASSLGSIFVSHVSLVTFTSNVENVDSLLRCCSTYMPFYNIHIKYSHDGSETNTRLHREKRPCLEFSFAEYVHSCSIYIYTYMIACTI